MLEHYFAKPETIDRYRGSWMAREIERYVGWMRERGYSASSVVRRVPWLFDFAKHAKDQGAKDAADAGRLVDEFVEIRAARNARQRDATCLEQYRKSIRGPLRQMLALAVHGGVSIERQPKPFPFQDTVPGFADYLVQERGVRPATVRHYASNLRRFERYLAGHAIQLEQLAASALSDFVIDCASDLSALSRSHVCGSVRVFLRYCHRQKIVGTDLSTSVELPRTYKLASLPRSIRSQEVKRMLACVDRRSATGRRDYAILLLLVAYGLRASEVASLTLDDIDWKHDRLNIRDRKAGNSCSYPLATPVAEALLDYLRDGRPTTPARQVFVRVYAPVRPITPGAVTVRARTYLQRAGVNVHRPGAHTLRHSCVQRLVDARFPFKAVRDYVGHSSSDSTASYAKMDLERLRSVALGAGEDL